MLDPVGGGGNIGYNRKRGGIKTHVEGEPERFKPLPAQEPPSKLFLARFARRSDSPPITPTSTQPPCPHNRPLNRSSVASLAGKTSPPPYPPRTPPVRSVGPKKGVWELAWANMGQGWLKIPLNHLLEHPRWFRNNFGNNHFLPLLNPHPTPVTLHASGTERALKGIDSMEILCKWSPSSLFIITRVPNAIHGCQTQHRLVGLERVCKTGAFQG